MAKDLTIITDIGTAVGLLLFTGADAALDQSTIFELLSKFGVIAVLWYWLKDLKNQLKTQLQEFRGEAKEIRSHYDTILENQEEEFKDYKDRIDNLLAQIMNEK